ncbi:NTP transferase domain-containing protein [Mucilaginibacter sp. HMF5004]|uniref:molybdenum cofactor guanylyltransferase n=1 Tax=Mucilaginibacter rivuli TaxID=2857527 RepID=UPI001C605510|nr:NTP transferase domain-containing protein [Mucilaginibacter rivuli]MBW4889963.1 NTP transferase domain-containing protein [Mucilaginibacter rivuli]
MEQLRGIVMCGGQSRRMGTDKGLIPIQNICWAAYMANKLADVNLPVVVSINSSQSEKYQSVFNTDMLVADSQNIAGPLNGLLSVHQKYPDDDLLLLACDMIGMERDTLNHLVEAYRSNTGFDYYVYQNEQFAEPFCGIYTAKALNTLIKESNLILSGLSFQKVLNSGNTLRMPITHPESFVNQNKV